MARKNIKQLTCSTLSTCFSSYYEVNNTETACIHSWIYTWLVPRPDFGRLWSLFVVICLQCPVFFPRRPLLPCHPAYAAPGRGVRPCPPREKSASTGADHPSSPLLSRLWWLFQFLPRRRKIPSGTLSVTPPFSFWMSGARLQHGERGEKAKLLLTAGLGEIWSGELL